MLINDFRFISFHWYRLIFLGWEIQTRCLLVTHQIFVHDIKVNISIHIFLRRKITLVLFLHYLTRLNTITINLIPYDLSRYPRGLSQENYVHTKVELYYFYY